MYAILFRTKPQQLQPINRLELSFFLVFRYFYHPNILLISQHTGHNKVRSGIQYTLVSHTPLRWRNRVFICVWLSGCECVLISSILEEGELRISFGSKISSHCVASKLLSILYRYPIVLKSFS